MLRIYHAPGTRSVRPVWLCHELGLPVEITPIEFAGPYRDTLQWRAISPAGKLPVLTDGDLTMFESGAMVEYILDRYGEGRLRPEAGTTARALCGQWCWFSEATLLRPLGLNGLQLAAPPQVVASALAKAREAIGVVDAALAGRPFMLGETFSSADVMMGYSLALLEHLTLLDGDAHPNAAAYVTRMKAREAFQRAMSA
ncbi:MAG TPA: glutathione S-transferase family protein [Caulobacteraceae bacterium]|jgi:glutathione S-transferase